MKTPREILLQKHAGAQPQLNALREQTLATLSHPEVAVGRSSFVAFLSDLFALPRTAWAGLATVWVAIVALNLATGDGASPRPTTVAERTPALRQALAEQRRFYAELIRSPMPADVPTFVPRPRSDGRANIAAA